MNSLVGHLRPRYKGFEDVTIERIIKAYLKKNPEATAHQIFNELSFGKGTSKSHLSAVKEGEKRPSSKWPKFGKNSKRSHR